MKKRSLIIAASLALTGCYTTTYPPSTRVSVGVSSPGASIGVYYSSYPDLVPIPGYPVYYAPGLNSNYFFYDGLYWVFQGDNWYVSSWYNGPWRFVSYYDIPVFVLRIPVRYYRLPPPYFRGWYADAPPRWGEHWGRDWEYRRSGWDRWDRHSAPAPAPLPNYQRHYSGDRYPRAEQQPSIRSENYRYQPREPVAQQYYESRGQQDAQRERDRSQPEQQRQQDERRNSYPQRQQDERREPYQQRQPNVQRLPESQRTQDSAREPYQQRQMEPQHQQDDRREQRRPPEQQTQDQQRQERQDRQPRQEQHQRDDRERQRQQYESEGQDRGDRGAPQERGQRDKDSREKSEWTNKDGGDQGRYR